MPSVRGLIDDAHAPMSYPKIELHVHLEGTLRPETLLAIAECNNVTLPATTAEGLADQFHFTDLAHFIDVWLMVTSCLRTADDFRRITVDYADEAVQHGAVYVEGIFAPLQLVRRGVTWETIYEGFCDGIEEARETHGLEMRLTPDLTRNATPEEMDDSLRYAIGYRDRGIVGVGLGAFELEYPPHLYEDVFHRAREGGLGSVPHAGELGPPGCDSRCAEPPTRRPASPRHPRHRGSRPRSGAQGAWNGTRRLPRVQRSRGRRSLAGGAPPTEARGGRRALLALHRRPADVRHRPDRGVRGRVLSRTSSEDFYEAGVAGALCDEATKARLAAIGDAYDWSQLDGRQAALG